MKFTKETARRMLRTFLQAAAGFLATTGITVLATNDYNVTKSILIGLVGSAIAAGIAAVMNLEGNAKQDEEPNFNEESEVDIIVDDQ